MYSIKIIKKDENGNYFGYTRINFAEEKKKKLYQEINRKLGNTTAEMETKSTTDLQYFLDMG